MDIMDFWYFDFHFMGIIVYLHRKYPIYSNLFDFRYNNVHLHYKNFGNKKYYVIG